MTKPTGIQLDIAADLNKWTAFLAIAEFGSLTRAALHLDSNQSVLSRQLNALERECTARLFTRTGRGVELSEMGQRIFPHVKALLADAEQLEQEIRGDARVPTGQVTVGLLPSFSHRIIQPLFAQMRALYPKVHLKILEGSSGQLEEWLADARVDISILYRYGASLPDQEQPLATVESFLIADAGDALTAGGEVPFSALDGLPFILPSAPNGLRNALDTVARREQVAIVPVIEADSLPLMKSIVQTQRCYTVLPLHAVWDEVHQGRLRAARIVSPGLQRVVSMALAKAKGPNRAVSEVAQQVLRIAGDMARDGMWRTGGEAGFAVDSGVGASVVF